MLNSEMEKIFEMVDVFVKKGCLYGGVVLEVCVVECWDVLICVGMCVFGMVGFWKVIVWVIC